MSVCDECGRNTGVSFTCSRCGLTHCYQHRNPEHHNCPGPTASASLRQLLTRLRATPGRVRNGLEALVSYSILLGPILTVVLVGLFIAGLIGTGIPAIDDSSESTFEYLTSTSGPTEIEREQQLQKAIHRKVNEVRRSEGREALAYSPELAFVAKNHSTDMAENDYFSHENQDGESSSERVSAAGLNCRTTGENLAFQDSAGPANRTAENVVRQWMNSPGHKANMLRDQWRSEGVGVEINPNGLYVTQVFCSAEDPTIYT